MKDIKNFIMESSNNLELMTQDLADWWEYNGMEDCYDSHSEFIKDMKALAKKQNDILVNNALLYLMDECEWDENDVDKCKEDIVNWLAQLAQIELDDRS